MHQCHLPLVIVAVAGQLPVCAGQIGGGDWVEDPDIVVVRVVDDVLLGGENSSNVPFVVSGEYPHADCLPLGYRLSWMV